LYSNWDDYGNRTKITRNENGNENYLIVISKIYRLIVPIPVSHFVAIFRLL